MTDAPSVLPQYVTYDWVKTLDEETLRIARAEAHAIRAKCSTQIQFHFMRQQATNMPFDENRLAMIRRKLDVMGDVIVWASELLDETEVLPAELSSELASEEEGDEESYDPLEEYRESVIEMDADELKSLHSSLERKLGRAARSGDDVATEFFDERLGVLEGLLEDALA